MDTGQEYLARLKSSIADLHRQVAITNGNEKVALIMRPEIADALGLGQTVELNGMTVRVLTTFKILETQLLEPENAWASNIIIADPDVLDNSTDEVRDHLLGYPYDEVVLLRPKDD